MITVPIKPISVNEAYKGRRFRTEKCSKFKRDLYFMLPDLKIPEPPYCINFKFGLSSASSDGDNCVKVAQDVISSRYNFNDKLIKKWIIEVENVSKGKEYISFKIESLT